MQNYLYVFLCVWWRVRSGGRGVRGRSWNSDGVQQVCVCLRKLGLHRSHLHRWGFIYSNNPFLSGIVSFFLLTAIICVSGEHQVEEDGEEGAEDEEMTEEEWSRRVAELNSLNWLWTVNILHYILFCLKYNKIDKLCTQRGRYSHHFTLDNNDRSSWYTVCIFQMLSNDLKNI